MMSSTKQRHISLVSLALLLSSLWQAEAKGEGQKILLTRGSLLHDELKEKDPSKGFTLFERPESKNNTSPGEDEADYNRYIALVKRLHIDVVAPGKGLAYLMNTVSTNFHSMLLADYGNFDEIKRPMLEAYLSVQFSDDDDIIRLSKLRGARNISGSCKSLLEKRDQALEEHFGDKNNSERLELVGLVRKFKKREPDHHHLASLMFENNLNLFFLESFLALCNRAKLDEEIQNAFASYESLF